MSSSSVSEKRFSLIALGVIAILVFAKTLLNPLGLLDDLWNYNVCRAFAMGYVPYRDYNMVMMPFFIWLFGIPLLISRTFFFYRVCCSIFLTAVGFGLYKTASRLTDKYWGLLTAVGFVMLLDVATYNGIILLIVALIFRMLIGVIDVRKAAVIGLMCAIAVLCRQTTGVFLTIAVFVLILRSKEQRKFIKGFLGAWMSVMVLFAVYLFATGSFFQFWDYCLFALFAPGQSTAAASTDSAVVVALTLGGIIADVVLISKNKKEYKLHLVLGLMLTSIGIPVVDNMHLLYSGIWFAIPIIRIAVADGKREIRPVIINLITVMMSACILFLSIYGLAGTQLYDEYNELKLIPVPQSFLDGYAELSAISNKYEQEGKNVVMFSSCTVIVSLMNEEFHPPYDLFLTGNLGSKSPVSYAEEACADNNNVILVPDTYNEENWTNPDGILEYIQEHCEPVESYANFTWYVPK